MSSSRSPETTRWPRIGWWSLQVLAVLGLAGAAWFLLASTPYRIDVDVYRMGAQAWLDGRPLYSDGTLFHTRAGLNLPFTYPPLAAIVFSPFAVLPLPVAGAIITLLSLALLVVAMTIVLTRLDVWPTSQLKQPAWWRRCSLAAAIVAPAAVLLEPIRSNFDFGQINAVLMVLVIADCVPRRTPWPRGLLLGLAIALKLTPAVFLLYFALRRDGRAALTSLVTFLAASLLAFALAWNDSWEYWTATVRHTDRIGGATLNTNQNIAGALARLGLGADTRFVVWTVACFAVLGLTIWAVRRVLRGSEPVLALICIALFGLVVSPVSWSHHWVWALPAVVVTWLLARRRRSTALAVVSGLGLVLMACMPFELMPRDHETAAAWWRQLAGLSYVWWALAVIVAAGLTIKPGAGRRAQAAADRSEAPISFALPSLTSDA